MNKQFSRIIFKATSRMDFDLVQVKKDLSNTPLKEFPDPALRLCWKGPKPFKSMTDVMSYFKTLALRFGHGKGAHLLIPPKNYLIITVSVATPLHRGPIAI